MNITIDIDDELLEHYSNAAKKELANQTQKVVNSFR